MATPDSTTQMKQCSQKDSCIHPATKRGWLPKTTEYFFYSKAKQQYSAECKACAAKRQREYIGDPEVRERRRLRQIEYRKRPERQQVLSTYYQREDVITRYKVYNNREDVKARRRAQFLARKNANPDVIRQRKQNYYVKNREKILEKHRERRRNISTDERLRINNRLNIYWHKRRALQRQLPMNFTDDDWQRALDYFNGCCAVCGRPRGLWHTLAKDHWIPLSSPCPDNPGTVPTNIVPLCGGVGGCNESKNNRDATEWLRWRFGKRKARQTLKRIEEYFAWVTEQTDSTSSEIAG